MGRHRISWKTAVIAAIVFAGIIFSMVSGIRQYQRGSGRIEIVYLPKENSGNNDFWRDTIAGAQSAAKEYQADLTVLAPDAEDADAQIRYIREAIEQKPDVIAISPILYSGMTEEIEKIREAGIPVILIDSKIDKDIGECYIGTDNVKAGIALGRELVSLLEADAKIAVMEHVKGASTAIEREEGMRQGMGESVEKKIDEIMYCDSDYDKSYSLTKELLEKRKDIGLVAGLNLYSVIGVARAVDELGLERKVKVIGFDNDKKGIQYMEEGVIDALVVQKPFNMGYLGIEAAVHVAQGKKVDKVIDSGMEVITVDNIYTEENQKLLFSF